MLSMLVNNCFENIAPTHSGLKEQHHVHTLHYDRGTALRLNGIGVEVILPMIDFKECLDSSFSLWNVKRCKRLLNTRKSSIFASGSPKHVLGPENNVYVVQVNYFRKLELHDSKYSLLTRSRYYTWSQRVPGVFTVYGC